MVNLKTTGIWYHTYNNKLIRTLEGSKENNSFQIPILFCNFQDMGDYTCVISTGLPGLEKMNITSEIRVQGVCFYIYTMSSEVKYTTTCISFVKNALLMISYKL